MALDVASDELAMIVLRATRVLRETIARGRIALRVRSATGNQVEGHAAVATTALLIEVLVTSDQPVDAMIATRAVPAMTGASGQPVHLVTESVRTAQPAMGTVRSAPLVMETVRSVLHEMESELDVVRATIVPVMTVAAAGSAMTEVLVMEVATEVVTVDASSVQGAPVMVDSSRIVQTGRPVWSASAIQIARRAQ